MKSFIRVIAAIIAASISLCGCGGNASNGNTASTAASSSSIVSSDENYTAVHKLSNPNATVSTQKVYDYLFEISGKNVLSAQQESTWKGTPDYEMLYIYGKTGKYPAMRGLDYMSDDFNGVNERALKWWNEGGLVTICWHTGYNFSGEWNEAMKTEVKDWDAVLTDGTPENKAFLDGMDKAAKALLKLQDEGVTVIWRPFHEFDGAWFWWGKGGSDNFIKLWRMMYDRYTNHWGLNNLIWTLGYSGNGKNYADWYPGDEYVDVIGADSYNGGAQKELYVSAKAVTSAEKPMCFHECGTNPTADELKDVGWVWFMTWHTDFITDKNSPDELNTLYNSDYVITKDELPKFQ